MPVLKIRNSAGSVSSRTLSKDQPLSIGRHTSNDIQVDEDGVATLHCRISWDGKGFQIASANSTGVVVNNQLTFRANLEEQDVIRVGSVELKYLEQDHSDNSDEIPLEKSDQESSRSKPSNQERLPVEPSGTQPAEQTSKNPKDLALTGEIVVEPVPPPLPRQKKSKSINPAADSLESILAGMETNPNEQVAPPERVPKRDTGKIFSMKSVRPGERDVVRSPVILFLGGGMLVLVLTTFTLLFLVKRESADQAFRRGLDEFQQKRFSVSIERFHEFIQVFPQHSLVKSAIAYTNLAKVEQVLSSAAPDWSRALTLLETYLRSIRDLPNFSELQGLARDSAFRIALGSATTAGQSNNHDLLDTSANAVRVLEMNSPSNDRPTDLLKQISDAQVKAELIIRRYEFTSASLSRIAGLLEKRETLPALREYQRLLDEYPDCKDERGVSSKYREILETDKSMIESGEEKLEPLVEDILSTGVRLLPVKRTLSRADLTDSGASVFVLAGGVCYAVDSGTGRIRWSRSVGRNHSFSPISVTSDVLCVLLSDRRRNELLLLQQRDGKLVWRLPLEAPLQGVPVVHEGRILFFRSPSTLLEVELGTGKSSRQVDFPQPMVGSPVLIPEENRIVVVGQQQFTYLLDARSLECIQTVQTRHRENAIQSPPIAMGKFVLFAEIDRTDSSRLSVWDFTKDQPGEPAGSVRIPGHVRDPAILRGKQLFIPCSGERVTSFIVSDQAGTPLLTRTATYQVPNGGNSAIFLKAGPEDELWMAGSLVQRLVLSVDRMEPTRGVLNLGSATQPLQLVDQDLVAVGHPAESRSIAVIAADRRQMSGRWQLTFGGDSLQAFRPDATSDRLTLLTDTGDVFEVSSDSFTKAESNSIAPIGSLPDRSEGYGQLHGVLLKTQELFVTATLPEPHWWLLNPIGQVISDGALPETPFCHPIPFAEGIVLPLTGKLVFLDPRNPKKTVESYLMTRGDTPSARWIDLQSEDETHFIACTDQGRLSRFQLQSEPTPHIYEVTHLDRDVPSNFRFGRERDRVFTASGTQLECWTVSSWDRIWNVELGGTASGPPHLAGNLIVVEIEGNRIEAYHSEDGRSLWQTGIESPLAGDPVIWNSRLILPLRSGMVLTVPENAGAESVKKTDLGRSLSSVAIQLGSNLILSGDDGSLIRVGDLGGENP